MKNKKYFYYAINIIIAKVYIKIIKAIFKEFKNYFEDLRIDFFNKNLNLFSIS